MTFNSFWFVPFLLAVAALYFATPWWTAQKLILVLSSYLFYAFFKLDFVILLAAVTFGTWMLARASVRAPSPRVRRLCAVLGVAAPLLLLCYFKYVTLFESTALSAAFAMGFRPDWALIHVLLPIGISFYLFHSVSYVIDVHRGRLPVDTGILDYNLYVTFFPQLVAGPIVRGTVFLPQCKDSSLGRPNADKIYWGICLFVFGLFQKMILADRVFAPAATAAFGTGAPLTFADAWIGALAFAGQIFADSRDILSAPSAYPCASVSCFR